MTTDPSKSVRVDGRKETENGYNESVNGKLRDEFLNPEIFDSLAETRVLI